MNFPLHRRQIFRRYVALPQDHGSWVFLLSPLVIGIFAGGSISVATGYLIVTSFAVFLIRQPITILIKVYSGRRSKRELSAALFWTFVYSLITLLGLIGLITHGYTYLLYLAIPGLLVFAWYLWLVSRRAERRQIGIEIVASGVLALTAPAGYWVGVGWPDPLGWLLFILVWLQSAASIVYAYLRLDQRALTSPPELKARLGMGRRALLYTTFNLLLVVTLVITGLLPTLLILPYALQWGETIWGTQRPAIGVKATKIGLRQLFVSILFTILFIITWHI